MTPSETAEPLAYCAAFDRRTVGRADVAAWQQLLRDVSVDDARDAVTEHYSTETRWLMPADILRGVRQIRAKRIDEAAPIYHGNPDETGLQSAINQRALLRAAGNGELGQRNIRQAIPDRRPLALESGKRSNRLQTALDAIGTMPPRIVPGVVNPLAVGCPHCKAAAGRACRTKLAKRPLADPHPARVDRARDAAAGAEAAS